jgi:nucleoside-diphosphate-sugar epimerase
MKTLIIGGTEFMGRETVRRLLARGHEVSVLHRRDHHDLDPAVRNLQADRRDLAAVAGILRAAPYEAVFDFAYDWRHGTDAGQVEAAARACGESLQRYVFMSSIAAYAGRIAQREDDPLASDDHPFPYVVHKASAERALFRMHAETGFPVTTVRPPFVHGPRQMFYREQFFWDRLLDGRPLILPDGGDTPMAWVYVDDVAEVCVRAIEAQEAVGQAFNVAHREPITQRSFIEALARVAGVEPTFVNVPRSTIVVAGGDAFQGRLYFGESLDLGPFSASIEKASRLLGFTPTPLDEALAAGFEWYQAQPRRAVDYGFEDTLLAQA